MDLLLQGIGNLKESPEIEVNDNLLDQPKNKVNIVLANPPFGNGSTYTITNDEKTARRDAFIFRRNFLDQLVINSFVSFSILLICLMSMAGLLLYCQILYYLRLPTGIFYANGVRVNVLFLENKKHSKKPLTKDVWFYNYRSNVPHTLKKHSLQAENLKLFVECYHTKNGGNTSETWSEQNINGRFGRYTYEELISRDKVNFEITS